MKIVFIFFLLFVGVPTASFGQQDTVYSIQDQWRTRIDHNVSEVDLEALGSADVPITYLENNEIPMSIKRKLQSGDYYGFTVVHAYSLRKEQETIYVIVLDKGDQRLVRSFNNRGEVLKTKRSQK